MIVTTIQTHITSIPHGNQRERKLPITSVFWKARFLQVTGLVSPRASENVLAWQEIRPTPNSVDATPRRQSNAQLPVKSGWRFPRVFATTMLRGFSEEAA